MSTRTLKTFTQDFREVQDYDLTFRPWLRRIGATNIAVVDATQPAGLGLSVTYSNHDVQFTTSGGTPGLKYLVPMVVTSNTGKKRFVRIAFRITGDAANAGQLDPGLSVVTLISSAIVATGTGVERPGSTWNYECALVANAPGAHATFRIRVGNTIDCASEFGSPAEIGTVTVSSTPSGDGKYRAATNIDGVLAYAFHAADIVSITGTGAIASVTGIGS